MDLRFYVGLHILLFASCHLLSQAKGDEVQSVAFLDSSSHRFLRERPSTELGHETGEMLVDDISAAAAVLLGFAPPSPLSKTSSSKLNELLFPNPFNRPRAVLMVEVRGIEAPIDVKGGFSNDFRYNIRASAGEHITVPADEKDLAVIPVDEPLSSLDIEFSELAHLLGGSYVGTMEAMDGVLTLPLPSGSSLVLRVSEKSELHYASSLASLVHGIKKAAQMHEGFSGGVYNPAELLIGTFTGIETLEEYGPDVTKKGMEAFQVALTKVSDLLDKHYEGKIVGIVIFNKEPSLISQSIFDMTFATHAPRFLAEVNGSSATNFTPFSKVDEMKFVRKTLAWITGIILIVATYIGAYLLLYMPLTKDTLLYANVKLD